VSLARHEAAALAGIVAGDHGVLVLIEAAVALAALAFDVDAADLVAGGLDLVLGMGAANHDVLGEGGRRGHAGGEKQSRNNIAGAESGTWGHLDLLWSGGMPC
jgi:hypothetical protein